MQDIIQLLPDHISNQIAAGEVIQRPASAVKELMENAIDAQAKNIQLIVKNSGKTLIQVIDDGIGMSVTDARLSFEKHATSKIRQVEDIFQITSKGFRGEALASIAAVSQVELKTRRAIDEIGTKIEIEGSKVLNQEPMNMPVGTQFLMKNLFYNIPARRNFLKSDSEEMRQIINEFTRLALSHSDIGFTLFHNGLELYKLLPTTLKQRIVHVFGNNYNEKLVPIGEEGDIIKVYGFVSKPDAANSKTKGKQYLFVNKRFIKSNFIQHAIYSAYKDLISANEFPFYVLFIDIDPKLIDVNVHPTKQEIKFEDEQLIYGFINAGIRRSLMQFNIAPSLDFKTDPLFNNLQSVSRPIFGREKEFVIQNESSIKMPSHKNQLTTQNSNNWHEIFRKSVEDEYFTAEIEHVERTPQELFSTQQDKIEITGKSTQILSKFIITPTNIGLLMIDQKRAHERILYDELLKLSLHSSIPCQKLLFPLCVDFSLQDSSVLMDIMNDLVHLGFDISPIGNNSFAIQGIPSDLSLGNEKELISELIENFKNTYKANSSKKETLLISICKISSIKKTQILSDEEIKYLTEQLFTKENYYTTPSGKSIFYTINYSDIEKHFN